jgi:hypothetical protein
MEPLRPEDPPAIGSCRLRARLGAGGMGRVYLVSSPAGRAVAVKVIHTELAGDETFRSRFVVVPGAQDGMRKGPALIGGQPVAARGTERSGGDGAHHGTVGRRVQPQPAAGCQVEQGCGVPVFVQAPGQQADNGR